MMNPCKIGLHKKREYIRADVTEGIYALDCSRCNKVLWDVFQIIGKEGTILRSVSKSPDVASGEPAKSLPRSSTHPRLDLILHETKEAWRLAFDGKWRTESRVIPHRGAGSSCKQMITLENNPGPFLSLSRVS